MRGNNDMEMSFCCFLTGTEKLEEREIERDRERDIENETDTCSLANNGQTHARYGKTAASVKGACIPQTQRCGPAVHSLVQ